MKKLIPCIMFMLGNEIISIITLTYLLIVGVLAIAKLAEKELMERYDDRY